MVENPPANAGDMGSSPGPGRSHIKKKKKKKEECNVKMKQCKMMSYRNYLAQCLERTVKTFSTAALLAFGEG